MVFIYLDVCFDFHSTDPLDHRRPPPRFGPPRCLPAKFLSRRMPPRGGGIYMALEIGQEQGGVLESPSFPGLPHRTNGEREDPRKVGEGFVDAADSSLTQSFSCSYTCENGS